MNDFSKSLEPIKNWFLDLFFPRFCLNCAAEGYWLCPDCLSLIDIFERQYCPFCSAPKVVTDGKTCLTCKNKNKLSGLYCASNYDNFITKAIINQFKYEPYIKELAEPLFLMIRTHLMLLKKSESFSDFILTPVPLHIKKLRRRGFNPPEEIGKKLADFLKIPIFGDILKKTKPTLAQVGLKKEDRLKNISGSFYCYRPELVRKRKVLLIDDIFTTGATMEECAKVLKENGAKEIWGIAVARG